MSGVYEDVVRYRIMDRFKVDAQQSGLATASLLLENGFREVEDSRGESVYLLESLDHDFYLAFLIEGLGTKNRVAELMYETLKGMPWIKNPGEKFFKALAQCNVAMHVNDMATAGAVPLVFGMFCAAGDSRWFADAAHCRGLIGGTKAACEESGATFGPGETQTLQDIVLPDTLALGGGLLGIIQPKSRRIDPRRIRVGDAIILIESSGIHANGLSTARGVESMLPQGYLTKLPDGKTFGETLLEPTFIYSGLVQFCLNAGIEIHYAVHITGHGWRKLMRAPQSFEYRITELPKPLPPVFEFLQTQGNLTTEEMYRTFNMGAGLALFAPKNEVTRIIHAAAMAGFRAFRSGEVRESPEKKVVIAPKDIVFTNEDLKIR